MAQVTFDLHHLARVEGHGNLFVEIQKGKTPRVEMRITEGTRLFESFLQGHRYDEASHIMSRICGICSHSHAIAALRGIEAALGIEPEPQTIALRKLMLIGDMLESHALHINLLALPDYLGAHSVMEMLPQYHTEITRALQLKKIGNDLMELIGGRHTHPLCAVIGGFTHVPTRQQLENLYKRLRGAIPAAQDQITFLAQFEEPTLHFQTEYLAVKHLKEFPLYDGLLTTFSGTQVSEEAYRTLINERNVPYSHAKFSEIRGVSFLVGALARINIDHTHLSERTREMLKTIRFKLPSHDVFQMNLGQAIEYLHYLEQAIEILNSLRKEQLQPKIVQYKVRRGTGSAAVEAPRGVLIHQYSIDAQGRITDANVVTPTAMNYANIEAAIHALIPQLKNLSKEKAELYLNMLIRAYDPCISCSVHLIHTLS